MPRIGYVINGVYHRTTDVPLADMNAVQQSTWKGADHDKQRFDHAGDIIQPFKNGKPNEEFINLYPEAAVDYGFVERNENHGNSTNPFA